MHGQDDYSAEQRPNMGDFNTLIGNLSFSSRDEFYDMKGDSSFSERNLFETLHDDIHKSNLSNIQEVEGEDYEDEDSFFHAPNYEKRRANGKKIITWDDDGEKITNFESK